MARIKVKGWSDFQHYKDRDPAWIKLHKKLLDNYDFHRLPVASRALAPMIWLLASESKEGIIDYDLDKIGYRLRMTPDEVKKAIQPLINGGFLELEQDASDVLSERKQSSIPEKEKEEETEREEESSSSGDEAEFEAWWVHYPRKVSKGGARRSFRTARKKAALEALIAGAKRLALEVRGKDQQFTPHPDTWLNQERWLDQDGISGGDGPVYTDDEWRKLMTLWLSRNAPRHLWGRDPLPGEPGCKVPPHIINEFRGDLSRHGYGVKE